MTCPRLVGHRSLSSTWTIRVLLKRFEAEFRAWHAQLVALTGDITYAEAAYGFDRAFRHAAAGRALDTETQTAFQAAAVGHAMACCGFSDQRRLLEAIELTAQRRISNRRDRSSLDESLARLDVTDAGVAGRTWRRSRTQVAAQPTTAARGAVDTSRRDVGPHLPPAARHGSQRPLI